MTQYTEGLLTGIGVMVILTPVIIFGFIVWIAKDDPSVKPRRKANQIFVK